MNLTAHRFAAAATAALLAAPAAGQAGTVDAVVGVQSDKVRRGASQSGGDAVASADARWQGAGAWLVNGGISTLGHDSRRGRAELTLGVGWAPAPPAALGGWVWQASAAHYQVAGGGSQRRPAYDELALAFDWSGRLQLLLAAAPAYPGPRADASAGRGALQSVEAAWHQRLLPGLTLDAGVGRVRYSSLALPDRNYGSIGVAFSSGALAVSATWVFSNKLPPGVRARSVLALSWQL